MASAMGVGASCARGPQRSLTGRSFSSRPRFHALRAPSSEHATYPMDFLHKRRRCEVASAEASSSSGVFVTTSETTKGSKSARTESGTPAQSRWLLVGLGNPGPTYDNTRHNVGFRVLDELAKRHSLQWGTSIQKSAIVASGTIFGQTVVLAKPITFMNNSGESVVLLMKKHGVELGNCLVVYDDLDIPLGAVRLRQKGGHGGHNGMRSILARNGQRQDFPRIKVGIGRPPSPQYPISNWVLGRFTREESSEIDAAVSEAVHVIESVLSLGLERAQIRHVTAPHQMRDLDWVDLSPSQCSQSGVRLN